MAPTPAACRAFAVTRIAEPCGAAALSKAFSGRPEGAHIIHDAITVEEALGVNAAFFRVPMSSNIADGPVL